MSALNLSAIRARDVTAPDYGPPVESDEDATSHALLNVFRDRRALLAYVDELTAALELTLDQTDLFPDVEAIVRTALAKAGGQS